MSGLSYYGITSMIFPVLCPLFFREIHTCRYLDPTSAGQLSIFFLEGLTLSTVLFPLILILLKF